MFSIERKTAMTCADRFRLAATGIMSLMAKDIETSESDDQIFSILDDFVNMMKSIVDLEKTFIRNSVIQPIRTEPYTSPPLNIVPPPVVERRRENTPPPVPPPPPSIPPGALRRPGPPVPPKSRVQSETKETRSEIRSETRRETIVYESAPAVQSPFSLNSGGYLMDRNGFIMDPKTGLITSAYCESERRPYFLKPTQVQKCLDLGYGVDWDRIDQYQELIKEQRKKEKKARADNDPKCTICLDFIKSRRATSLACAHVYHTDCIYGWIAQRNSCPACRGPTGLIVPPHDL